CGPGIGPGRRSPRWGNNLHSLQRRSVERKLARSWLIPVARKHKCHNIDILLRSQRIGLAERHLRFGKEIKIVNSAIALPPLAHETIACERTRRRTFKILPVTGSALLRIDSLATISLGLREKLCGLCRRCLEDTKREGCETAENQARNT